MLKNGKSVVVKVKDRDTCSRGKVIDLSPAGASKIGLISAGIAKVKIEKLKQI